MSAVVTCSMCGDEAEYFEAAHRESGWAIFEAGPCCLIACPKERCQRDAVAQFFHARLNPLQFSIEERA